MYLLEVQAFISIYALEIEQPVVEYLFLQPVLDNHSFQRIRFGKSSDPAKAGAFNFILWPCHAVPLLIHKVSFPEQQ